MRLCPICGKRLVCGWPKGRAFTTQDGRRVAAITWRHRAAPFQKAPPDCAATWPEEDARDYSKLVRRVA